jgi:hypothetical protein
MQTINKQSLTLDLKKKTMISTPHFIQGDTNILEFTIKENDAVADFSNIGRIVVNYKRSDGKKISRLLVPVNDKVVYQLGIEEMEVPKYGEIELQFFNSEITERVSTLRFKIHLSESIGTDMIYENSEDLSVLQELFVEVEDVIERLNNTTVGILDQKVTNVESQLAYVDSNVALLDSKINSQASGSPKGAYPTLSDLQTVFPTGNTNIYLVLADGKWYYWSGAAWVAGGVYQGTSISDGAVSEEKTTLQTGFYDIRKTVEYLTGNSYLGTTLKQEDIVVTNGSMTVTNGDVKLSAAAGTFTYFLLNTNISAWEFTYGANPYFIVGEQGTEIHMLGLGGSITGNLYRVLNGNTLGSKIATLSFTAAVAGDRITIIRDDSKLIFKKNGADWFTLDPLVTIGAFINRFGLLPTTGTGTSSNLITKGRLLTKSLTTDTGKKKIESTITSLNNLNNTVNGMKGSSVLVPFPLDELTYVNATVTRAGETYNIGKVSATYGWANKVGTNKIQFKYLGTNSPVWWSLCANGTNAIALSISGQSTNDTGKVINATNASFTQVLARFSNYADYVLNAGDEVIIEFDVVTYLVKVKVKRVGTAEFVDFFTRDLSSQKSTLQSIGEIGLGLFTLSGHTLESLVCNLTGNIEEKADKAYATAKDVESRVEVLENKQPVTDTYYETIKTGHIGDSITVNNSVTYAPNYITTLKNMYAFADMQSVAVSGSAIARKATHAQDANAMCLRYTALSNDRQVIFVRGGTNDYRGPNGDGVPIGIKGSTDVYTFYGALKVLIEGLIAKFPTGKILFITPTRRDNDTTPNAVGHTLIEYVDAIIDMCKDYSIPCLDLYRRGYVNQLNINQMTTDGLHLNPISNLAIGRQIGKFAEANI